MTTANPATSTRSERAVLAVMLTSISGALFMVFLVTMIFAFFPLRLLDPSWQLRMISTLTNNAPISVVAFVLLPLAVWMNPSTGLKKYTTRIRRLAILAVIGFLLLIPLQFNASRQQFLDQDLERVSQLKKAMTTVTNLRQAVERAENKSMLQQRLQSLPDPTSLPASDLEKPFPLLKQELYARIERAEAAAKRRFAESGPMTHWARVRRSMQTSLLCLCYAFAYTAGAVRRNSKLSLLLDIQNGIRQSPKTIKKFLQRKKRQRGRRNAR